MASIYNSESRIEYLKQRAKRCVCKYCGGKLNLKQIVFNDIDDARVEIFCANCDRIEFGVEPEIYISACNFVSNYEFNYYEGMSQNETSHKMNIAKVCDIFAWGCKNIGILEKDGFNIDLKMEKQNWDECMVLTSKQVEENMSYESVLEEIDNG